MDSPVTLGLSYFDNLPAAQRLRRPARTCSPAALSCDTATTPHYGTGLKAMLHRCARLQDSRRQTDSDCGIHTMMHIQRFVRNPTNFLGHESGSMTTWERLHPRTIEEDILRGRKHLHEKLTGVRFQEHAAESPTTSSAESGTEAQTKLDITGSDCDSEAEPDQHMAAAEQALAVAHAATTPQPPSTESCTEPQTKLDITGSDCDSEAEPDQHMAAAEQALAVAHAATNPQPPSTESGTEPQTKLDITGSDCDSEAEPDQRMSCTLPGRLYLAFTDQAGLMYTCSTSSLLASSKRSLPYRFLTLLGVK
eukprot:g23287.t1